MVFEDSWDLCSTSILDPIFAHKQPRITATIACSHSPHKMQGCTETCVAQPKACSRPCKKHEAEAYMFAPTAPSIHSCMHRAMIGCTFWQLWPIPFQTPPHLPHVSTSVRTWQVPIFWLSRFAFIFDLDSPKCEPNPAILHLNPTTLSWKLCCTAREPRTKPWYSSKTEQRSEKTSSMTPGRISGLGEARTKR